jgi:hypothetical protein
MQHHLLLSKTAAITGGTTGIGRAIALEYVGVSSWALFLQAAFVNDMTLSTPPQDALVDFTPSSFNPGIFFMF